MVIDRLDSSGNKLWGSGIDITSGISTNGFNGNISMCVDSKRNLYVTWDAPSGNILHTKILNSGSFGWVPQRIALSTSSPLNASRCNAKINSNDSVSITWLESANGTTNAMLQKVAPDGGLSLPAGGLAVGVANNYYGYPQISFDGNKTVCVFTAPTNSTIGLGAQSINPDNTFNWSSTKVLGDLYLAWNFYQDYTSLDATGGCNAVFWTGYDGNIYAGSTCKIVDILPIRSGTIKIETLINGSNKISWQGYNQQKGDAYSVERSSDGAHFISIGEIATIGLDHNYSFIDRTPLNGINYYRIKTINETGIAGYSNIVKAINENTRTRVSVYPNPVKNILTITLENTTATGKIIISDMSGKILKRLDAQNGTIGVDLSGFASGIYFVKYNDSNNSTIIKVQKY